MLASYGIHDFDYRPFAGRKTLDAIRLLNEQYQLGLSEAELQKAAKQKTAFALEMLTHQCLERRETKTSPRVGATGLVVDTTELLGQAKAAEERNPLWQDFDAGSHSTPRIRSGVFFEHDPMLPRFTT